MYQHVPAFNPNAKPGQTYDESIALIRDRAAFLSSEEKFAILELTAERVFFSPAPRIFEQQQRQGMAMAPESTSAL